MVLRFNSKSTIAFIITLVLMAAPAYSQHQEASDETNILSGWKDGKFYLASQDGNYLLNIGGRIQPRYQYQSRIGQEDISSFFMRRIRLDLQGHLFNERLTYRIMPEMAAFANLRDGWVQYSFSHKINLKAGQYSVPFHRQRFISSSKQHFAERSLPSEEFGFPSGYDIGVGINGRNHANTFSYGAGIFDGFGRNVRHSNSSGHLVSARMTLAALGQLPGDETGYMYHNRVQVDIGGGLQGANKNEVRNWDLGRSEEGNIRADWLSATADVSINWKGFSLAVDGFLRHVDPDDPAVDTYNGWAVSGSSGYFLIEERLEITARYSEIKLDRNAPETFESVWDAGFNIYQYGHNLKTYINYSNHKLHDGREHAFLIQWHLMF